MRWRTESPWEWACTEVKSHFGTGGKPGQGCPAMSNVHLISLFGKARLWLYSARPDSHPTGEGNMIRMNLQGF